jgi:hypothetical protein
VIPLLNSSASMGRRLCGIASRTRDRGAAWLAVLEVGPGTGSLNMELRRRAQSPVWQWLDPPGALLRSVLRRS